MGRLSNAWNSLLGKDIIQPEVPPVVSPREQKVPPKTKLLTFKVNSRIKNAVNDIGCRIYDDEDTCSYDFEEIRRVEDKESYLAISFRKHIEMVLKRGWTIKGKNNDFINHVRTRLWEIFILTGVSTKMLMRSLIGDLIRFSNAYIVLKRSDNFPISGNPYTFRNRTFKPIVGMFRADPSTMKPMFRTTSRRKKLSGWKNVSADGYQRTVAKYSVDDVIHLKWNDKGLLIATPFVVPVLDDIRALRRMEEFVELVASKHAFPLYHYKVGLPDAPAEIYEGDGGGSEVESVATDVENMPTEGCWVTSERHSIEAVGAEGAALDLKPYLEHFENRVISGIGISGISLGRGSSANRSTAVVIDKILIDRASDIQEMVEDALTSTLLFQLHLDSGRPFGPDDMAQWYFPPVDSEEQRAHENHVLNQWNNNTITESELREELARPALSDKQAAERFIERTDVYLQQRYAELAKKFGYLTTFPGIKMPSATGNGSSGGGSSAKKSSKSGSNSTKNRTQPTNQSGTKATKSRYTANSIEDEIRELKYTFASLNDRNIPINVATAKGFISHSFMRIENAINEQIDKDLRQEFADRNMAVSQHLINKCRKEAQEKHLQNIYHQCIIRLNDEDSELFPIFDQAAASLNQLVDNLPNIYEQTLNLREPDDAGTDRTEGTSASGSPKDPS